MGAASVSCSGRSRFPAALPQIITGLQVRFRSPHRRGRDEMLMAATASRRDDDGVALCDSRGVFAGIVGSRGRLCAGQGHDDRGAAACCCGIRSAGRRARCELRELDQRGESTNARCKQDSSER